MENARRKQRLKRSGELAREPLEDESLEDVPIECEIPEDELLDLKELARDIPLLVGECDVARTAAGRLLESSRISDKKRNKLRGRRGL